MSRRVPSIPDVVLGYGAGVGMLLRHGEVDKASEYALMVLAIMCASTAHLYAQPVVPNQPTKG